MNEFDRIAMLVCNDITAKIENGELSLKDKLTKDFIPCIFEEGNIKFLMAIARAECSDEDYESVMKFLLKINQARLEGKQNLNMED